MFFYGNPKRLQISVETQKSICFCVHLWRCLLELSGVLASWYYSKAPLCKPVTPVSYHTVQPRGSSSNRATPCCFWVPCTPKTLALHRGQEPLDPVVYGAHLRPTWPPIAPSRPHSPLDPSRPQSPLWLLFLLRCSIISPDFQPADLQKRFKAFCLHRNCLLRWRGP